VSKSNPQVQGEEAVPKMRFLHYKEGGYLAPHTDLCRCDWKTDKRTTHTFILYLRDPTRTDTDNADTGGAGGETVLMHTLKGQDLVKVRNSESWTVERRSGCIMSLCPSICQIEAKRVALLDNAEVTPKRGRLLVFPHLCPHKVQTQSWKGKR